MSNEFVNVPAFRVRQRKHTAILMKLTANDLARISYVAARGYSTDKTAVQRLLTKSRITGVREFAEAGGDFPASIVLNWVNLEHPIKVKGAKARIPLIPGSAQLLDGQHRVEGLKEAMKTSKWVQQVELPVAVYEGLSTQDCADIFLSINTEQKPVSKDLVYDLFEIASEYVRDDDALAARKVVDELNINIDSPYKAMVRYPGPDAPKGGMSLSTMVTVLKPLLAINGAFDQVGVSGQMREDRISIILNWFKVIRAAYGTQWTTKDNVFRYASGFWGAIEFLSTTMLPHCNIANSFEMSTMQAAMKGLKDSLIWQRDVSGLQGRKAAYAIAAVLGEVFRTNLKKRAKIKV